MLAQLSKEGTCSKWSQELCDVEPWCGAGWFRCQPNFFLEAQDDWLASSLFAACLARPLPAWLEADPTGRGMSIGKCKEVWLSQFLHGAKNQSKRNSCLFAHKQRKQSQCKFSVLLKVYQLQQEVCKVSQQLCDIFTQPTPQDHNMINAT